MGGRRWRRRLSRGRPRGVGVGSAGRRGRRRGARARGSRVSSSGPRPSWMACSDARNSSARARISSSAAPWRAARARPGPTSRRSKVACSSVSAAASSSSLDAELGRAGTRGTAVRSKRWSPARWRHSARSSASVIACGLRPAGWSAWRSGRRRPERSAEPLHLGDDLGPAAGERPAHVAADADDLGDAVAVHLVEHEPEPGGELTAQGRLEDRLGRRSARGRGLGRRGRCDDRRGLRPR